MRNILITGASYGLGKHLREHLLNEGHSIFGTTRNLENAEESNRLRFFYLDFRDKQSIDQLVNYFISSNVLIDVLIHNSGVAYLDPADVLEEEECRHIFDVNFFGPLYLTKKLLPLMKKAECGNLIFVSSIVSIDHWPFLGVYAASKSAMDAVAFEWAVLLKKWNIYVSVLHPNPLPTDMKILRSKNASNSPYPQLKDRSLQWEDITEFCQTVSKILMSPSPQFSYQTGPYSRGIARLFFKKDIYQKKLLSYQKEFLAMDEWK